MKTTLIIALLCIAGLTATNAHAQQTEALRKQFLECKPKAEQGEAVAQARLTHCLAPVRAARRHARRELHVASKETSEQHRILLGPRR